MRLVSIWIGKLILLGLRLTGRGGSALPGLIIERLNPKFMVQQSVQLKRTVLVAGTNGKTTTAKMLATMLENDGQRLVRNVAGSNMTRGVISALLENSGWGGKLQGDTGLFEVDEAFVAGVAAATRPDAIVVLNLLRDQLDRYHELERTAWLIGLALPHAGTAVLNADDPMVANLETEAENVLWFGAKADIKAQLPHDDALHGGDGETPDGDNYREADVVLTAAADRDDVQDITIAYDGVSHYASLRLTGVYNAYNAAAAFAAAAQLDVDLEQAAAALGQVEPAFGRGERIKVDSRYIQVLLVKNPSGFNQVINAFLADDTDRPVLILINDNFADGRDVSWLWDVNFEVLKGQSKRFSVGGVRAADMAVRLKYTDIVCESVEESIPKAVDRFIESIPVGETGYLVPTYTAMLEARKYLAGKVEVKQIWK